jgi:hypothetical protein
MRHYPRNSPQAAARILALALLSDGHLTRRELDVLDRLEVHAALGLGRNELHTVLHGFCEDLLASMHMSWGDACHIDQATLAALMADIDDPTLRQTLLDLCLAVIDADDHVADGESMLLGAIGTHWGVTLEEPARTGA